jgi:hypothetical protein
MNWDFIIYLIGFIFSTLMISWSFFTKVDKEETGFRLTLYMSIGSVLGFILNLILGF